MKRHLYTLLLILPTLLFSQKNGIISGKVLDENGDGLPFASVFVRNTTIGTAANVKGEFRLSAPIGKQELVFQYLGYKQKSIEVTLSDKTQNISVTMDPSDLEIKEVVITTEDPADRIMREAIAKRQYFREKVQEYSADVYIKGFHKLIDTPKKVFGKDVGDMDGMLDSNRTGVLYLSESVSKVFVQKDPERRKEVMISSKVSGGDNGYSINRSTLTDFDLYAEKINIERDILSPLADNAFSYYRFKYMGEYRDAFGFKINKIKVIPKRENDPTFGGFLYIVDEQWNLASVDLYLSGNAIKQPILDTLQIQQTYVPMELPDNWRLLSQNTVFKFGIFGFKIRGFFNGVFSNYNLHPKFDDRTFDKETFKVEESANNQNTDYWEEARPVPLTEEENRDYIKKDSLSQIWNSAAYLDSTDRKSNRFRLGNLLGGYSWQNSFTRSYLELPGAFKWVQFNTVQGLALNFEPTFTRYNNKRRTKFWLLGGDLNYGFSEKKWRGNLRFKRQFESKYYRTLEVSGGTRISQFNARNPIGELINASYSLIYNRNYMKLYDQAFAQASWSQVVAPGINVQATASWNRRAHLQNNTDYSWYKGERPYASNDPVSTQAGFFTTHDALIIQLNARFQPGVTYSSYPDERFYEPSQWPVLKIQYQKAIAGIAGSDANFDFLRAEISKNDLSWGLAGYTEMNVSGGVFLSKKRLEFIDFYHPNGNRTSLVSPAGYLQSFFMLPYYAFSTDKPFVEFHAQHHLQGWLFDKIPLVRKLNLKEVFGVNVFYTERASNDDNWTQRPEPYWELNFGFENLGFKPLRAIRVDVVAGFYGNTYDRTGIVVGMGF